MKMEDSGGKNLFNQPVYQNYHMILHRPNLQKNL